MKIVIIHSQSHEGSTCMVARELANKVGGERREFFLPQDFHKSCLGCYTCFQTDLRHCPHYKELEPLVTAILEADLLIHKDEYGTAMASGVFSFDANMEKMYLTVTPDGRIEEDNAGPADEMGVRDPLESVAQKHYPQTAGSYERTMWSIVYCPEGRCADFYFAENYEHSYGLLLLEKGSFLKR